MARHAVEGTQGELVDGSGQRSEQWWRSESRDIGGGGESPRQADSSTRGGDGDRRPG